MLSATGAVTRSKMRKPATVAAALLPRPAATGMSLSISANTVGTASVAGFPCSCLASAANARSTTLVPRTAGRLLTMGAFALSCFGLLLYLWVSFGGTIPLAPQGYRFQADFPSAVQLSEQADLL